MKVNVYQHIYLVYSYLYNKVEITMAKVHTTLVHYIEGLCTLADRYLDLVHELRDVPHVHFFLKIDTHGQRTQTTLSRGGRSLSQMVE